MRYEDKVAVITGSGSGIGRATALRFANEGAKVVVVDIAVREGEKTVEMIEAERGMAFFVNCDITNVDNVKNMANKTIQRYGHLDILFNNAGYSGPMKLLHKCTESDFYRTIDINLKGAFLCSKYVIPQMIKQGGGVILNAGSDAAIIGHSYYSIYCATKGGIIQLTKAMASEYAKYNIRVNCTCPGPTDTPMTEKEAEILGKETAWASINSMSLFGRAAKPEEIASVVVFLASDDAKWITGAVINIDGGYVATCGGAGPSK